MDIPHEVEELILSFLGITKKKRCFAQTKHGKRCKHKTSSKRILCSQHMKIINRCKYKEKYKNQKKKCENQIRIETFINLCIKIYPTICNIQKYKIIKRNRKRIRGKTYYPSYVYQINHYT